MNTYVILAASDVLHQIFDVYIDTVEAWTSYEAIEIFQKRNFALCNSGYKKSSGMLQTRTTLFKAFPIVLDTDNPFRYIYWLDGENCTTVNTVKEYLRKEKN